MKKIILVFSLVALVGCKKTKIDDMPGNYSCTTIITTTDGTKTETDTSIHNYTNITSPEMKTVENNGTFVSFFDYYGKTVTVDNVTKCKIN